MLLRSPIRERFQELGLYRLEFGWMVRQRAKRRWLDQVGVIDHARKRVLILLFGGILS